MTQFRVIDIATVISGVYVLVCLSVFDTISPKPKQLFELPNIT